MKGSLPGEGRIKSTWLLCLFRIWSGFIIRGTCPSVFCPQYWLVCLGFVGPLSGITWFTPIPRFLFSCLYEWTQVYILRIYLYLVNSHTINRKKKPHKVLIYITKGLIIALFILWPVFNTLYSFFYFEYLTHGLSKFTQFHLAIIIFTTWPGNPESSDFSYPKMWEQLKF